MAVVLVAVLAAQMWAGAGDPNAARAERPRPAGTERPMLAGRGAEDRLIPADTVLMLERSIRQIQPAEEQKKKIDGILQGKEAALSAARQAFGSAAAALNEACTAGDEAAIRAASTKVGQTLADLQVLRSKVTAELKAVLTPEQLKKIEELKANAGQRMQEMLRSRPAAEGGNRRSGAQPPQPRPQGSSQPQPTK
jgi:Spy/CpxP family protein refolding chaperone